VSGLWLLNEKKRSGITKIVLFSGSDYNYTIRKDDLKRNSKEAKGTLMILTKIAVEYSVLVFGSNSERRAYL